MLIPNRLMPHGGLVSYRPRLGTSAYEVMLGSEIVPNRAKISDKTHLVRTSRGEEATSTAQVTLDPDHVVPLGSEVTVWVGTARARTSTVIAVSHHEHGDRLPTFTKVYLE